MNSINRKKVVISTRRKVVQCKEDGDEIVEIEVVDFSSVSPFLHHLQFGGHKKCKTRQ